MMLHSITTDLPVAREPEWAPERILETRLPRPIGWGLAVVVSLAMWAGIFAVLGWL